MVGAIIDGGRSMVRPYSNGTIYHSNSVLPIMAITNPVGSLHEATAGASLLVCNYGGGWGRTMVLERILPSMERR